MVWRWRPRLPWLSSDEELTPGGQMLLREQGHPTAIENAGAAAPLAALIGAEFRGRPLPPMLEHFYARFAEWCLAELRRDRHRIPLEREIVDLYPGVLRVAGQELLALPERQSIVSVLEDCAMVSLSSVATDTQHVESGTATTAAPNTDAPFKHGEEGFDGDRSRAELVEPTIVVDDEMPWHPAASKFRPLEGKHLEEFAEDIRSHGQRFPCVFWRGPDGPLLLDGRNRVSAAKLAGLKPTWLEYIGDSPVSFILSANEHRRHESEDERLKLAMELVPLYEAEARHRQRAGLRNVGRLRHGSPSNPVVADPTPRGGLSGAGKSGKSRDQAAAAAGVGSATVRGMLTVKKRAPELYTAWRGGLLPGIKPDDLRKAAALPETSRAAAVAEFRAGQSTTLMGTNAATEAATPRRASHGPPRTQSAPLAGTNSRGHSLRNLTFRGRLARREGGGASGRATLPDGSQLRLKVNGDGEFVAKVIVGRRAAARHNRPARG